MYVYDTKKIASNKRCTVASYNKKERKEKKIKPILNLQISQELNNQVVQVCEISIHVLFNRKKRY